MPQQYPMHARFLPHNTDIDKSFYDDEFNDALRLAGIV